MEETGEGIYGQAKLGSMYQTIWIALKFLSLMLGLRVICALNVEGSCGEITDEVARS